MRHSEIAQRLLILDAVRFDEVAESKVPAGGIGLRPGDGHCPWSVQHRVGRNYRPTVSAFGIVGDRIVDAQQGLDRSRVRIRTIDKDDSTVLAVMDPESPT